MTNISDEFEWSNDDSVVFHAQPAIAVYANQYDQVVIRREREWNEEDDAFITISAGNVLAVIAHILGAAGMNNIELIEAVGGGYRDVDMAASAMSKAKDPKAADRQRRCRANKKLRERDNRDNDRDARDVSTEIEQRPDMPPLELVG